MNKTTVSIILPTYNEKGNIPTLVSMIQNVLKNNKTTYEIIIVDDNSPDGTGKIAQELSNSFDEVKTLIRIKEKGLATAIRDGIKISEGKYILLMDTDFSHNPKLIPSMINKLTECDLVIMSRYVKGGKMITKRIQYELSKVLNYFIKYTLGLKVRDTTNGFFIIKKNALEKINMKKTFSGYGDYFFKLLYALKKQNITIKEIPFTYEKRKSGISKTSILKQGLRYIYETIKLRLS